MYNAQCINADEYNLFERGFFTHSLALLFSTVTCITGKPPWTNAALLRQGVSYTSSPSTGRTRAVCGGCWTDGLGAIHLSYSAASSWET